ncbi:MAG TPA: hypothetical protein VHT03_04475 [Rhizomicrobium sp.]|jgi:hypothetical protein|nr:hypothetical protein [Rhizomicrobium sp.]
MQPITPDIEKFIEKAKNADAIAAAESDPEEKTNWLRIAASWRLLAERILVERTGGELLLH